MNGLLLIGSWVLVFVAGVEVGGRWAAWFAKKVVADMGISDEFRAAAQELPRKYWMDWRRYR